MIYNKWAPGSSWTWAEELEPGSYWGSPLHGGSFCQGWRQKFGEKRVFAVPKARRIFFEPFLDIYGQLVNENWIKRGFWGGLGRNISKFRKKANFRKKINSTNSKNFEILLPRCHAPPPQIAPWLELDASGMDCKYKHFFFLISIQHSSEKIDPR